MVEFASTKGLLHRRTGRRWPDPKVPGYHACLVTVERRNSLADMQFACLVSDSGNCQVFVLLNCSSVLALICGEVAYSPRLHIQLTFLKWLACLVVSALRPDSPLYTECTFIVNAIVTTLSSSKSRFHFVA